MEKVVKLKLTRNLREEVLTAMQFQRELGPEINSIVGGNLFRWREEQKISYSEIWEKLKVSAIDYRQWETGKISPQGYRFYRTTEKLGPKSFFEAGMMVNELLGKANEFRLLARLGRWDQGCKPLGDALGVVSKFAA